MKKFKFRLEQVLKYRLTIKAERKRELLLKNMVLKEAEEKLANLSSALLKNGISTDQILPIERLMVVADYSARLKAEIVHQKESIEALKLEVAEALAKYIEAAKEASALEKLKERRSAEYIEKVAKEDERYLDELAIQRSGRNLEEKYGS